MDSCHRSNDSKDKGPVFLGRYDLETFFFIGQLFSNAILDFHRLDNQIITDGYDRLHQLLQFEMLLQQLMEPQLNTWNGFNI